jgi:mRNA-degrading endonuclease RelE of RelBE toxin-antitoxin system
MNSSVTRSFRERYQKLEPAIQQLARKNFRLWKDNPRHPSLQFKKVRDYWSVRVGLQYRAVALLESDTFYWFWIGPHDEYERLIGA